MADLTQVTHVALSLDCGGLERIILDLIREGQRYGQRVAVVCLERPGMLAPQAEELGARVLCVNKRPGLRPGIIGRLKAVLRELRPDVLHTHQIGALLYSGPAARAVGVPLVVHTEHLNHFKTLRSLARRLRMSLSVRLAARYAARFFCVSEDIAAEVQARRLVPHRKVSVVLNGINTARFGDRDGRAELRQSMGIPPGAPVVGTVGRVSEQKRQDLLLRAFARVKARVPDARLLLVGDGPLLGDLRGLATTLGLNGSAHFAGYQAQPERFLQAMDVFALTSSNEGLPLAVLEAAAAGLPVIASRVGGLPDLFIDGQTGALFDFGDEVTLVDGLCRLLLDGAYAQQLGAAGRQLVTDRYDVRHMAQAYDEHYRASLDTAGR